MSAQKSKTATKKTAVRKPRASTARAAAAPAPEAAAATTTATESTASAAPAPQAAAGKAAGARGARILTGRVVSHKMQKTIAVEIERLIRHPTYGKFIRRTTKLLAHDESGASQEGDLVMITPCRPMSRHKSWRLLEVIAKAAGR